MATAQAQALAAKWPRTHQALQSCYYQGEGWTQTSKDGKNDAGYALQGLQRAASAAQSLHSHRGVTPATCDIAFARETYYHHARGTKFRRPVAGLSACWAALVLERPGKLYPARSKEARRVQP